jgi:SAM-dependent methyltransferase
MTAETSPTAETDSTPDIKKTYIELFLLSLASLFVELLIIRWMSADIRAFTIFKTFPLVTCFVGLGAGMAISNNKWFRYAPLALAQMVVSIKLAETLHFQGLTINKIIFPSVAVYQWGNFEQLAGPDLWGIVAAFMLILLLLLAGPFSLCLCLGNRIGQLFGGLKPLSAYTVNVTGAIAGSVLFGVASFLRLEPWALWILPAAIIAYYLMQIKDASTNAKLALVAVLITSVAATYWIPKDKETADTVTFWSPYQKIDVKLQSIPVTENGQTKPLVYAAEVRANWVAYQWGLDVGGLKKLGLNDGQVKVFAPMNDRYSLPYIFRKPKDVLIVGSGSGTDVCQALNFDADHIDAVDIDPVILEIGKNSNPGHPYASPKVTAINDDARHYFDICPKKYDLVVFGLLDSQTVMGMGASIRVDNFVYTEQSVRKVLTLLKPDGLVVLTFGAPYEWLGQRLYCTLKAAAGYAPIVVRGNPSNFLGTRGYTYILGKSVQDGTFKLPALAPTLHAEDMSKGDCGRILTDDWPYLYLNPQGIDIPYILIVAEILLLSLYAGRRLLLAPADARSWQLFFQGAAFMLLELQCISRLALVYGSTWLTTSIVINGVLLMILLANFIVMRFRSQLETRERLIWFLLFGFLLLSYFLPTDSVLHAFGTEVWIGRLLVTVVTLLPIFGAGLIFAIAFAGIQLSARALAFNLFGAVVGAMLEYSSNFTGINALVLLAMALYFAAFACFSAVKKRAT